MSKQTAIDWLIDKHFGSIQNCTPDFRKHIEQAKQMEKEQIIDAYYQIGKDHQDMIFPIEKNAEQYYNETYNNERKEGDIR